MSNLAAIAGIKCNCFRHHLVENNEETTILVTEIVMRIAKYATCPSLGGWVGR